jgi:hypothetical protein
MGKGADNGVQTVGVHCEQVARRGRYDEGVRVIEPVFDGTEATCRLVCRPIPGSDPPEVEYSCRPSADCDRCELITEIAPDGTTIRWCKCVDDGGGLSAAKAVKVKEKASAKAKAKRRK